RARPEDPFPHIARLFLRSQPASGPPSPAPEAARGQESAETRASLQWLIAHRPDLRNELTHALVHILISGMGDVDEAAQVLSAGVTAAADLEALAKLARLASRIGDLALETTILDRAAALAASQAGSLPTVPSLHAILEANLVYSDDAAYFRKI